MDDLAGSTRAEGPPAHAWLSTLTPLLIGLATLVFGGVQAFAQLQETARTRIVEEQKSHHDWGTKVVELYLHDVKAFDLAADPRQASINLQVLGSVAPEEVKQILDTLRTTLPSPASATSEADRLTVLASFASLQDSLAGRGSASGGATPAPDPRHTLVYVQYPDGAEGAAARARTALEDQGFKAPGIERVAKVPSRLEVRYYRANQRPMAERLAIDIGRATGVPASSQNAVQLQSSKALPEGILELWLPVGAH